MNWKKMQNLERNCRKNSSKCCRGFVFRGSLRGHKASEMLSPQEPQCAERMVPGKGAKAVPREWFSILILKSDEICCNRQQQDLHRLDEVRAEKRRMKYMQLEMREIERNIYRRK